MFSCLQIENFKGESGGGTIIGKETKTFLDTRNTSYLCYVTSMSIFLMGKK